MTVYSKPSTINLAELKELLSKATDRPWEEKEQHGWHVIHSNLSGIAFDISADNAALIVAAVNHLPDLIARVEEYEAALKYYADPVEWCSMGNGAYADIGKKARDALEKWELPKP